MIKIINGKKYDTDTATLVSSYSNGYGYGDFKHISEEMYQKKNGEFFLYGEGGALSKYSTEYGNSICGGEKITPLTVDEAKTWIAEHNSKIYEDLFGEVEE